MNCRRYRRNVSDRGIGRLKPGMQDEMALHEASCPNCARCRGEEAALLAAWKSLPNPPAPDLSSRLIARINADTAAVRRRSIGYFGYAATVSAAIGVFGLFAWMHRSDDAALEAAQPHAVAQLPAHRLPLSEMLTEVRWQSSEERNRSDEPPSYNEETRALLLPETGAAQ